MSGPMMDARIAFRAFRAPCVMETRNASAVDSRSVGSKQAATWPHYCSVIEGGSIDPSMAVII